VSNLVPYQIKPQLAKWVWFSWF